MEIDSRTTERELFQLIAGIRISNPQNLMARHFDEKYFLSLGEEDRHHFLKIIASGLEYPDSQIGAYARKSDDYERFALFFDPLIKDFHHLPPHRPIAHHPDWNVGEPSCDLKSIDSALGATSMRVRVARNFTGFAMPARLSKSERLALEERAFKLFDALFEHPRFGGSYFSLSPGSPHHISHKEHQNRVEAHQMFKDMRADKYLATAGISAHWPHGRGMYISRDEDFLVWVGEEDHLRIMAMHTGSSLNDLFLRLRQGLEILQTSLSEGEMPGFATSSTYGVLTSCPTNLGAGMRASLHLNLPNLSSNGRDVFALKEHARPLGLTVRGASGEHSGSGANGLVDISPTGRLGVSEKEIMLGLYEGCKTLWWAETRPGAADLVRNS